MPRVELVDITKRFGRIVAVDKVNLTVEDGEYVTILGPSGCGKTTLVKIVSGIWEPTEGKVLIDGEDVTGLPPEERDLGYVFQNIALFPHMRVWGNVTYAPWVKGLSEEEIESIGQQVLELVNLLDQKQLFPSELSGGAQQKVSLARALATRAKFLVLDEPLSALDARVRLDLRYELRRLVKDLGLTAMHVTHDQEEAMSVADRVVVMRAGRIVEVKDPKNLYERPSHIFTANFVGESNFLEGRVTRIADSWAIMELRNRCYLRVHADGFKRGDAVVVAVRPENTVFEKEIGPNRLPGTVEDVRFMGSFLRYEVRLVTDDLVFVDSPLHVSYERGERVVIGFKEERMLLYPRPYEGLSEALKLE